MGSFVCVLVFLAVVLYLAVIYESVSLALLGFAGAVLLVCSFFYLLAARRRAKGDITVPIRIAERDRQFFVQISVAPGIALLPAKMCAVIRFGEKGSRRRGRKNVTLKPDGDGTMRAECCVTICDCGTYSFCLDRIQIYDVTGLFCMTKRCRARAQAIVLPEPEAVPVVLGDGVRNFFGDADTYDDLKPGYDAGETFDVRPFQNGDRLQEIHWKLSAKSDSLIVKENSRPKACPIVCFLTPERRHWKRQLSQIASLSYSLMDAGCPHFAVWQSADRGDILRTRVDDEESYYLFVSTFMQDMVLDAPGELAEEYRRKYRGERYLHEITVDGRGIFAIDGSPVAAHADETIELILN